MSTTTHERALEQLPWFLNGTLGDDERREVEDHLASCPGCRAELAATRRAFQVFGAHLPPEALSAFVLEPEAAGWEVDGVRVERGVLVGHLAHCEACRGEVALLREGLAEMESGDGDEAALGGGVLPFAPPPRVAPPPVPRWVPFALAASLLFAIVAGGGWLTAYDRLGERRQAVARLENDLEAVRAELVSARRAGGGPEAEHLERQMESLKRQIAELDGRLEEQRREAEDLLARAEAGPPQNPLVLTHTLRPVERGGTAAGGDVPTVSRSEAQVIFRIDDPQGRLASSASVRYRVVDGQGVSHAAGELTVRPARDAFESAHVAVTVDPAGLPAGRLTLEILDAGEVAGSVPFAVAGSPR
jgi:anti-sigma factor RsiW